MFKNVNVKRVLAAGAVAAVCTLFVALSIAFPREGLNVFGVVTAKLWHLALFAVFWFAVYALGRGIVRILFGRSAWPPDLVWALGVAATALAAFALCAVGLAYGWLVKALVVAGAAAGAFFLRKELVRIPERTSRWLAELEPSSALLLAGTVALALPFVVSAAVPPFYWDALTYHLAVPKAYADAHGFIYMPDNVYASMPMGGSLFYLVPYLWDGLITAKSSHLVATVLALSLAYRVARTWLSQFYAALTCAFVLLTSPVIASIGGGHNDHFQMLFAVAALYVYFKWSRGGEDAPKRSWLALGAFVGAALAVKYSAYAVLVAFAPVCIYDLIKKRVRLSWLAKGVAVAFCMVAPWLVKAFVERGNPVFPLFYGVLGGRDFAPEQSQRLLAWQLGMGKGRGFADLLLMPYRVSVEGDVGYKDFSGIYLPFLLPLAALAAVFFRRAGRLVAFGWVYLLAWFFGPQQLRFLDAGLPALAAAAAGTLAAVEGRWEGWPRRAWRSFVTIGLFVVSIPFFAGTLLGAAANCPYLFRQDRDEFLRGRVGFFAAQEFINTELPADAKVLLVFTNHTLYLERDAKYDSFLEASPLLIAAEKAEDSGELYALAREWGCDYVHVYHSFEPQVWPYYEPRTREVFYDFVQRYGVIIYQDPLNEVYELVGGER